MKPKARVVRIDCRRSYVRWPIKGTMMSFKEETAEGINAKMIELTKTREHKSSKRSPGHMGLKGIIK